MVNWVTFTSFNGGSHKIQMQDDLDEVMECIKHTTEAEECEFDNYENLDKIREKLKELGFADDIFISWENSTWMTIQRFGGDVKEFFPMTSICKEDILLNTMSNWTEDEKKIIEAWSKHMMETVARKMSDAYLSDGYWMDLEIIARSYVEAEGEVK